MVISSREDIYFIIVNFVSHLNSRVIVEKEILFNKMFSIFVIWKKYGHVNDNHMIVALL